MGNHANVTPPPPPPIATFNSTTLEFAKLPNIHTYYKCVNKVKSGFGL